MVSFLLQSSYPHHMNFVMQTNIRGRYHVHIKQKEVQIHS